MTHRERIVNEQALKILEDIYKELPNKELVTEYEYEVILKAVKKRLRAVYDNGYDKSQDEWRRRNAREFYKGR